MAAATTAIAAFDAGAGLMTPIFRADYFDRWTAYVDATPRSLKTYTIAIRQFAKYLEKKGITEPARADVLAYREELKETKKATTVQSYITAVKLFFRWTAQEGLYPNIADNVKGVKIDTEHKKDPLSAREAKALLDSVDRSTLEGKRDYAILALMLTTGLRTVSVSRANVEDARRLAGRPVLFYQGKGHDEKAEYVILADQVDAALREYLKARGPVGDKAPLFASTAHRNPGERLLTGSVSRIAKEHMRAIGLDSDRLTAHSLRHTAATVDFEAGATPMEVKQLLGHQNINTTLIYVHEIEHIQSRDEQRIADAIYGS